MKDDPETVSTPPDGTKVATRIRTRRLRDPELVSTPNDKTPSGLPRETRRDRYVAEDLARQRPRKISNKMTGKRSDSPTDPRRPAVWNAVETFHDPAPAPVYGAFPTRFLDWALRFFPCHPRRIVHICSGTLTSGEVHGGTRVDIREDAEPDVVADGRDLPFADGYFGGALIDPPYSVEYARDLYGTEYPRPSHLLAEAARVVEPCGRIGFVHYLVPNPPPGCFIVAVRGVTQGCGYRIRALTVYEKAQDELDFG